MRAFGGAAAVGDVHTVNSTVTAIELFALVAVFYTVLTVPPTQAKSCSRLARVSGSILARRL